MDTYEKKYKDALERAKAYNNVYKDHKMMSYAKGALEYIFPELAESEDERISKDIIAYMRYERKSSKEEIENRFIPWLEKQAEQNPAWSEEDEKYINDILAIFGGGRGYRSNRQIEDWLKSLKPQSHWKPTEEQMSMLLAVLNDYNNITAESVCIALKSLYTDLKKL